MGQSPKWATPALLINGHLFSHASIEAEVDGLFYAGITAISYSDDVSPGILFGMDGSVVGRTPGTGKASLSLSILRREWDMLRGQLVTGAGSAGDGSFGTKSFQIHVSYHEEALPKASATLTAGVSPADPYDQRPSQAQTVMDVIEGVRVTGVAQASAAGADPALVVLTCAPLRIRWGGTTERGTSGGATNLPEPIVKASSDQPDRTGPTGEWWSSIDAGFEGPDYAGNQNPWDGFILAGFQLPGLCRTTATPKQIVDTQKPNGSDASALIVRGYGPCELEVEVTLWLRSHWVIWQQFVTTFWRPPNKSSPFEKPELKTKSVQAAKNAPPDNRAIIKERAAIDRSETNARLEAFAVYHPSLAALGISAAIITSIEAPTPGPQPQTMTSRIRLVQYIQPAGREERPQVKRVHGTRTHTPPTIDPHIAMDHSERTHANSPSMTPADTDTGPGANFTPASNFSPAPQR